MELGKTVWILLFVFSNEVLCENDTSITNIEESTSELVPVAKKPDKNQPQVNVTVMENNAKDKYNSSDDPVPKDPNDFTPTNSSNFAYVYDDNKSKKTNKDTEVSDLLNVTAPSGNFTPNHPNRTYEPDDPVDTQILLKDDSINVNFEGMKTIHKTKVVDHVALVPGTLAAILAGVFLAVSIAGYISLLSWRRYLENRYGNREMLVEEDYCEKNMNDLEHFSI